MKCALLLVRLLLAFCSASSGNESYAQEAKVRTSLGTQGDLWVGERIVVVVELLAPGFFAGAASFDLPDPKGILLIPPPGSPIVGSEEVSGVSYTVQRHELSIFAQRAGRQTIPSLTVRFQFKRNPLDKDAVSATVKTEPLQFTTKLPPGAEKLGGVISARGLRVEENWKPEPAEAKAGDAFTRTITYSAPDVPAMAFPPWPMGRIDGLGIYPKAPEVLDHSNRGQLQGERRDVISYVCERAGIFVIPAVRLTWWDLESKSLKTIDFPARTLRVTANSKLESATERAGERNLQRFTNRAVILAIAVAAGSLGVLWLFRRYGARWIQPFRPVHLAPLNPPPVASVYDRRCLSGLPYQRRKGGDGHRPSLQ